MRSMPVEEDIFRRLFRPTPQKSVLARKTDSCGVKAPAAADPRAGRGTTDKARKYEVPSTRTSGSSDSRHRKVAASKAAQAAAAAAEAGSSIEVLDGRSTVVTDLARISHADTPRPTSSDSSLPPIGTKSRSRSLSPDTAAAIHAKFSRQNRALPAKNTKHPHFDQGSEIVVSTVQTSVRSLVLFVYGLHCTAPQPVMLGAGLV
jgi:hypothetical protein